MIPPRLARLLAFVPLLLALGATAAHAGTEEDFDRGAAAHRQQDYKTAFKIWLGLAEKGQADAQYNVARMLQDGDGAAQNPVEAMRWYRKAAEQGDQESQYYLGLMYLRGEGVAVNEAEAQKWFAMNRKHHTMHHNHAQWEKWQQQLAEMNRGILRQ
ncbi:MAG: tetratricopeptide repeat protein [Sulfuricella sp.]